MKKLFIPLIILALAVLVLYFLQGSSKLSLSNFPKIIPTGIISQKISGTDYNQTGIALEVTSPKNGEVVNIASMNVRGKTTPGAEIFVNELELKADAQGDFSQPIILDEGENTIVIVANDASGNSAEKEIKVSLVTLQ